MFLFRKFNKSLSEKFSIFVHNFRLNRPHTYKVKPLSICGVSDTAHNSIAARTTDKTPFEYKFCTTQTLNV